MVRRSCITNPLSFHGLSTGLKSTVNVAIECFDCGLHVHVIVQLRPDFLHRMLDCGVIAVPKDSSDFRKRMLCILADEEHGDMAGPNQLLESSGPF